MKRFRDTNYWITVDGRVWSERSNKFMKGSIDSYGYAVFKIRFGKSPKLMKIHRLVAECYLPNPYNKETVNHIDCNKLNNHVCNLEWATPAENNAHGWKNGLFTASNRKFTKDSVREIKRLRKNGMSVAALSVAYGCEESSIYRLLKGETYKEYQ